MQILANALPGFRDLRAPVIAGYMWLLFGWLLVQPDPNHRPENHLGAALYDLGQDVGRIWITVAIGVVAYFIGSISQSVSKWLRLLALKTEWAEELGFGRSRQADQIRPVIEQARRTIETAKDVPARVQRRLRDELRSREGEAEFEAVRELELPAILLVGDQSELFAEVDRLRAEGELRMDVALPLVALGVLCAVISTLWWLTILPAALVLFLQGMRRDDDAKKSVAEAIRIGRVPSSTAARLATWANETLPQALSEAREPPANSPRGDAAVVKD